MLCLDPILRLVENLVRTMVEMSDNSLWFGTFPYQRYQGGIRYEGGKSLPDRILELLPDRKAPKDLQPRDVKHEEYRYHDAK